MQRWFIIICGGLHADRGDPLVWSFPSVYVCRVCVNVCVPHRRTFAAAGPTVTMRDSSPYTHTHKTHTHKSCKTHVASYFSFNVSRFCHFAVFVDKHIVSYCQDKNYKKMKLTSNKFKCNEAKMENFNVFEM